MKAEEVTSRIAAHNMRERQLVCKRVLCTCIYVLHTLEPPRRMSPVAALLNMEGGGVRQRRNTTVSVAVDKLVSANKRAELHAGRVSGDAHCVRAPLGRGE